MMIINCHYVVVVKLILINIVSSISFKLVIQSKKPYQQIFLNPIVLIRFNSERKILRLRKTPLPQVTRMIARLI